MGITFLENPKTYPEKYYNTEMGENNQRDSREGSEYQCIRTRRKSENFVI